MLRKLSLAAAAAVSLGVAALAPLRPPPGAVAGTAVGIPAGTAASTTTTATARASTWAGLRTATVMAAAMPGGWFRLPGAPAGGWSTAAIDAQPLLDRLRNPGSAPGFLLRESLRSD